MIPLPEYAKIKDNYCVAYMGHCRDYLVQLRMLRPYMEAEFPGVKVFICCRDEYMYLLKGEERTLGRTELKESRGRFAYIRELVSDGGKHPVESFMDESAIPFGPVARPKRPLHELNGSCVLLTNGWHPNRSLSGDQIRLALDLVRARGSDAQINKPVGGFDWVVGVECDQLWEAAAEGKCVTLISSGFGENLFLRMFPEGEIISLPA